MKDFLLSLHHELTHMLIADLLNLLLLLLDLLKDLLYVSGASLNILVQ